MNLLLLSSMTRKLILLDETVTIETNLWAKDSGTNGVRNAIRVEAIIRNKGINVWSRARDLPETRGGLRVYGRVIDGSKVRGIFTRFLAKELADLFDNDYLERF